VFGLPFSSISVIVNYFNSKLLIKRIRPLIAHPHTNASNAFACEVSTGRHYPYSLESDSRVSDLKRLLQARVRWSHSLRSSRMTTYKIEIEGEVLKVDLQIRPK